MYLGMYNNESIFFSDPTLLQSAKSQYFRRAFAINKNKVISTKPFSNYFVVCSWQSTVKTFMPRYEVKSEGLKLDNQAL